MDRLTLEPRYTDPGAEQAPSCCAPAILPVGPCGSMTGRVGAWLDGHSIEAHCTADGDQ